jgi:hypothetical protein
MGNIDFWLTIRTGFIRVMVSLAAMPWLHTVWNIIRHDIRNGF